MKRTILLFLIFLLSGIFSLSGCAQQQSKDIESLKKEMTELKEGQKEILKDIKSIKKFLRIPEEFKEAVVDITNEPFKGDTNAKVTLIEFSDYQ